MDKQFLEQLCRGNTQSIKQIYRLVFPKCQQFVLHNSGTPEDAKDIFQETLLAFIQKINDPTFQLKTNIQGYLYGINKNLWLKALQKKQKKITEPINTPKNEDTEIDERQKIIKKTFKELGKDCQKVLSAFYFRQLSLGEIAEEMNYSQQFIKVKKKRCMDYLKKLVTKTQNQTKYD